MHTHYAPAQMAPAVRRTLATCGCLSKGGRGENHGLRWQTLRFEDATREAAYLSEQVVQLRWRMMIVGLIGALLVLHPLSVVPMDDAVGKLHWARKFAVSAIILLSSIAISPCLSHRLKDMFVEPIVVVALVSTGIAMAPTHYQLCMLAKWIDLNVVDSCDSSKLFPNRMMLGAVVLAISNGLFPLRSCSATIVNVVMVVMHAILVLPGKNKLSAEVLEFMAFTCVAAFNCLGCRARDFYQRVAFTRVLEERTTRVAAEFQLAQAVACKQTADPDNDERISIPASQTTAKVFAQAGERPQDPETLESVMALAAAESWLLEPGALNISENHVLGHGAGGIVVRGTFSKMPVAVKIPKVNRKVGSNSMVHVMNELRVLRKVRHPNIVVFHGACFLPPSCCMVVTELVTGAPMSELGNGVPMPSDLECLHLLQGIVNALAYLHSQMPVLIHGDVKPENICIHIDAGGRGRSPAKLLDFGLARVVIDDAPPCGGTVRWAAPELILGNSRPTPAPQVDVFSIGRILFFVATGRKPYANMSSDAIRLSMALKRLPALQWSQRGEPTAKEETLRPIAENCMAHAAAERPAMDAVEEDLRRAAETLGFEDLPREAQDVPQPAAEHRLTMQVEHLQARFARSDAVKAVVKAAAMAELVDGFSAPESAAEDKTAGFPKKVSRSMTTSRDATEPVQKSPTSWRL